MSLDVFSQVVRTHEPLVANWASESLLTCVCPQVALQLVAARESLATEEPIADEWPLARVPTQMGLQVGRLAVDFATAWDVTRVNVLLAQMGARRAETLRLLTIGTIAHGTTRVSTLAARRGGTRG